MRPKANKSADPVERVGSWKNSSTGVRSMKYSIVETVMGGGGLGPKTVSWAPVTQNVWFIGVKSRILRKPVVGAGG